MHFVELKKNHSLEISTMKKLDDKYFGEGCDMIELNGKKLVY